VIERFQLVVVVVIVAAVVWFLFHRLIKPRLLERGDTEP
jgi:p-aminobenzoyl-glutamate transporter AbgT